MSEKNRFSLLRDIRGWQVGDVVTVLKENGLDECAEACQKRQVDGDTLLGLSEFALRFWGRDLSAGSMRKLSTFIQDVNENPEKYIVNQNATNSDEWDTDWEEETEDDRNSKGIVHKQNIRSKGVTQNSNLYLANGTKHQTSEQNHNTKPQDMNSASHVPKKLITPPIFNTLNLPKNVSTNGNGNNVKQFSSLRRPEQSHDNRINGDSLKSVSPPRQKSGSNSVNANITSEFQRNLSIAINKSNEKPELPSFRGQQNGTFRENKPLPPPSVTKPQLPARPPKSSLSISSPSQPPVPQSSLSQTSLPQPPLPQLPIQQTPLPHPPTHKSTVPQHANQQPLNKLLPAKPQNQQPLLPQPPNKQPLLAQPPNKQPLLPQPLNQPPQLPRTQNPKPLLSHPPSQQLPLPHPPSQQPPLPHPPSQQPPLPHPPSQQPQLPQPPYIKSMLPQPPLPKPPSNENNVVLKNFFHSLSYEIEDYEQVDELASELALKNQLLEISGSKGNYPHVKVPSPVPSQSRSPGSIPPANEVREETSFLHSSQTSLDQLAAKLNEELQLRNASPVLNRRANQDFLRQSSDESSIPPEEVYESIPEHFSNPVIQNSEQDDGYEDPILPVLPPKPIIYVHEDPKPPVMLQKSNSCSSNSNLSGSSWLFNSLKKKTSPNNTLNRPEKSLTPDGKTSNTPTLPRPSHAIQDQRQSVPRPLPPTPNASENIQRPTIKIPVVQMPWYFNVDRTRSKEILRNYDNGTFMIRPSTQTQNPLTLTLKYNERTFNIVVRLRPDGKYALGTEKLTEENFSSVEELVNHYMTSQLALYSNGRPAGNVTLTKPPRKDNAYV